MVVSSIIRVSNYQNHNYNSKQEYLVFSWIKPINHKRRLDWKSVMVADRSGNFNGVCVIVYYYAALSLKEIMF